MQQAGKTIDEIAARLGKSRKFVYSRIKLSELIEPFQQILLAAKMGVQQSYEIARLSAASQNQIFKQYCSDWQQEYFQMPSAHVISCFRCDLACAPFDITVDNLVPATPACTNCPLNSATLKSLFPELATEAVCSGLHCYQGKVRAHFAVREGTLTAENVEAEIKRVQAKEDRSLELDREKVQLAMHAAFFERFGVPEANSSLAKADQVAVRLIVFQSLDYQLRYQVAEALELNGDTLSCERYFETLVGLSETQFAYLLRMAVAGNSESKRPQSINGWSLRAVAAECGLDVESIEQAQQKAAHNRGEKVKQRLLDLQQRKERLPATDRSDQVYN